MWLEIKKRSGKIKEELKNQPLLRPEAHYLWELYCDIKQGCEKVTYAEIDAYTRLKGKRLEDWEVALMVKLEKARCENGR